MGDVDLPEPGGVPPSATNPRTLMILIGVIVGIVAVAAIVGQIRGGDDEKSSSSSSSSTTTSRSRYQPYTPPSPTVTQPPAPAVQDDQFIAALSKMKGWPDRAQVIASSRAELIAMGRDACQMQEQSGEGSISTSAWVSDVYEIPGNEAGAVTVAAFEVYCPDHA